MSGPMLTPELLERFRQIGLRIARDGQIWHQGEVVSHDGLRRAILRWLDVLDDGRTIVRLDERRYAYIDVDDAHLRARSLRWDGDRAVLALDDGSEEVLDPATLEVAGDHALYCRVRGGRLRCRLTTAAQQSLASHLVERDGGVALSAAGQLWPLADA